MMTTLEIQRRLLALGFDPGPLDGVRGRRTIAAIRHFQERRGLEPDGIAGPKTLASLFAGDAVPAPEEQTMPWLAEARRLMGTPEVKGSADNPLIIGWAQRLGLWFPSDATAWCGLFVAHCIGFALPHESLPANPLGARNWLNFGRTTEPGIGAVLVFWRGSRTGWQGHVGFYEGEDERAFHVLGGNQSDRVSIARIGKERLLGARWPASAAPVELRRVAKETGGALSTNEA